MKRTLTTLAALLLPLTVAAGWTPQTQCYVFDGQDPVHRYRLSRLSHGQWHHVSLRPDNIPDHAVSATLGGIQVTTHQQQGAAMCDIRSFVKHPLAPRIPPIGPDGWGQGGWNVMGQVVTVNEAGARSTWTFTVPLNNGGFDVWWESSQGFVPAGCSLEVTLFVQSWCE